MRTDSPARPLRLLYIDDSEDDRGLVEVAVERTGKLFALHTADGAGSAARYFRLRPDADSPFPRPDLILLDYDLGTHTGTDFLIWLRVIRQVAAIPVVIFSGSAEAGNIADCYKAGANHFLHKPVTLGAIETIICALHLCISSNPPDFGPLTMLPEYEPDPRKEKVAAGARGSERVRLRNTTAAQ